MAKAKVYKKNNNLLMAALLVLLAVGLYLHSEGIIARLQDQKILGAMTTVNAPMSTKMGRLDVELQKEITAIDNYTSSKFTEFNPEFVSNKELGL